MNIIVVMHSICDDYEQVGDDMKHDNALVNHKIRQRPNSSYQPTDPPDQNDHWKHERQLLNLKSDPAGLNFIFNIVCPKKRCNYHVEKAEYNVDCI